MQRDRMSELHAVNDADLQDSGQPVRKLVEAADKPSRTCPPAACVSADAVQQMLDHTLDLRALYDFQVDALLAVVAATEDPAVIDRVRAVRILAGVQRTRWEDLAGFLDDAQARLRSAEAKRDWDDLAGTPVTATAIGEAIKDCLDDILSATASSVQRADARADLATWFDQHDEDVLTNSTIAYILGKRRALALEAELKLWRRARTDAGAAA